MAEPLLVESDLDAHDAVEDARVEHPLVSDTTPEPMPYGYIPIS